MKVLVVNSNCYIGAKLSERLLKDGHEIVCLGTYAEAKCTDEKTNIRYVYPQFLDSLEKTIRNYNSEVVFYISASLQNTGLKVNCVSLSLTLDTIVKCGVKDLICLAQNNDFAQQENINLNRIEKYACECYQESYGLRIKYLEFDQVFGEDIYMGLVPKVLQNFSTTDTLLDADQEINLIYADDAVDIALRLWNYHEEGFAYYPKAANCTVKYGALRTFLAQDLSLDAKNPLPVLRYSSAELMDLNWQPKYTLAPKLRELQQLMHDGTETENNSVSLLRKKYGPYLENIALFCCLVLITIFLQGGKAVNSYTELDLAYLYILVIGLLYGKTQAFPAVVLSSLLCIWGHCYAGGDIVSFIYEPRLVIRLACYMFLGAAVGYTTDSATYAQEHLNNQLAFLQVKYKYLYKNYQDVENIKNTLYRQIVNSNDSIGRLYNIIKGLDSLKPDRIYMETCVVVSDVMQNDNVAIYSTGKNPLYMRQRARVGTYCAHLPKSLYLGDMDVLSQTITEKRVFVNRNLLENMPDMAAPVFSEDRLIALVCLYKLPFDAFNLHNEVLIKVISSLAANALLKAHTYELSLAEKMYLPNTFIMRAPYFQGKLEDFQENKLHGLEYGHARLLDVMQTWSLPELSRKMDNILRDVDVVGIGAQGDIEILLANFDSSNRDKIEQRLQQEDIKLEWITSDIKS